MNEAAAPPKGMVQKGMYLVDNLKHTLEDILADDNGSYSSEGSPTNSFHYDGSVCAKARLADGKWCIKQRNGKKYQDVEVPEKEVFILHRLYRQHKTEENFTNTVCRIKNVETKQFQRYCLVTYDWSKYPKEAEDFVKKCHGNAKKITAKSTPFIRTAKDTIQNMRSELQKGVRPQVAYGRCIESSGGPMRSSSMSKQPRNPKQVG